MVLRIGFLGGTGIEAKGLALRFASAGVPVVLGSRSADRAKQAAADCNDLLGKPSVEGLPCQEMISSCEIIFLTVPYAEAGNAVTAYQANLRSHHVLVDVTVPMQFVHGHAVYLEQSGKSNSEVLSQVLPPGIPLVAAFKTLPAAILANLEIELNCSLLVCSDSAEAKNSVMAAASLIPTLRVLDGGPLSVARTLERMSVLAINLNRRYRQKGARFKIAGI
jgi:8-hydroxy-5-deazaflavin:NADPH oxidoreductase